MADTGWTWEQCKHHTFRELYLIYQHRLEERWAFRSNLLAAIQNQTVAMIRLQSKAKPKVVTPDDCNPFATPKKSGTTITAENFEDLKNFGDMFLQMQ